MTKFRKFGLTAVVAAAVVYVWIPVSDDSGNETAELERKAARAEYFFNMLRDPATNRIPPGIRIRELESSKRIPKRSDGAATATFFDWTEMGPDVLAGRTRAVALDVNDSQTILAGAASGGVWKSVNAGFNWRLTSDYLGVTSIAQDPRPGHTDTWYFSTGEMVGSTRTEFGISPFFGNGIHKSTDGGESWSLLPATAADPTVHEHPFNFTWRIRVSPATGSVFVAGNGFGVYRSSDGGDSFDKVIGEDSPAHVDLAVNSEGAILAILSSVQTLTDERPGVSGLLASFDDGDTWEPVPAPQLNDTHHVRSVLAFAPSHPDVAYVLSESHSQRGLAFHKVDLASRTSENRSGNIPDFNGLSIRTQGGYNMAIAVKPDDENFVLISGIGLWRFADGMASSATEESQVRISGHTVSSLCVDHHELVFDPNQPTRVWIGCDQGVFTGADVTGESQVYREVNDGYNVSQFYAAAMPSASGDPRIVGGMQDWGTVAFESPTFASLIGVGDGGYAYMGERYAYSSLQNGIIIRHEYAANGGPLRGDEITNDVRGVLFINPFVVDPVGEQVLYYPASHELWRNDNIESRRAAGSWENVTGAALPERYFITALGVSTEPAHVLYYAGFHPPLAPVVYRLASADTASAGAVEISVPNSPIGAYPSSIAVNPVNADEILIVFSNYNIVGLHHSVDGGATYVPVEGNLEGSGAEPGPSIRSATILPQENGTLYLLGTSTGVYSTDDLKGMETEWLKEGADVIGDAVVAQVSSRQSDGRVLVASHGRGIFVGDRNSEPVAIEDDELPLSDLEVADLSVFPNPTSGDARATFMLANPANVRVAVYDVAGRLVIKPVLRRHLAAGRHELDLEATRLPSGSYVLQLDFETSARVRTSGYRLLVKR